MSSSTTEPLTPSEKSLSMSSQLAFDWTSRSPKVQLKRGRFFSLVVPTAVHRVTLARLRDQPKRVSSPRSNAGHSPYHRTAES